jgi:hypothetical protein
MTLSLDKSDEKSFKEAYECNLGKLNIMIVINEVLFLL